MFRRAKTGEAMQRMSHDVPGVAQRINKLTAEIEESAEETAEVWKDDKGRQFIQKHYAEIRPNIASLTTSLAATIELFEEMAKRLRDPDDP